MRVHEDNGCRSVVDARCIAGCHRAFFHEYRLELRHLLDGGAGADVFVLIDHYIALARRNRHRGDFLLEPSGLLGRLRLVLGGGREFVLCFPRDLPALRHVLRGIAHVIAVEGIP